MENIPIIDLKAQYRSIRGEVRRAIDEVLESQQFILGPTVEKFEHEVATYLGCRHAIGVASGSDALLLSLMALGIGAGDGVVVPPFTFIATVTAITRLGATPIFVDIEPENFLLDVERLDALLKKHSDKIKAAIPVHLFGRMCPMAEIAALAARHRVRVVEDVAQAFGASAGTKAAGTIGALGCFSFFPTKILGGMGDGGLVATGEPELAAKLRMLRAHGESAKYNHTVAGVNSRLDAIQAAVLRVKLRHVDAWREERIRRADLYQKLFLAAGLPGGAVRVPAPGDGNSHVFNYYVVRAERRDELKTFLTAAGVQTEIYYPLPLHLQPCFGYLNYRAGDFPNAEKAAAEVLALPLYPELKAEVQECVVGQISAFYKKW